MANPFVNNNTFGNINMNNLRNVYQMLMGSRNPEATFLQMAQNNPQLRPIAEALRQGGSPEAIFNQMCQQRGINGREFIKQITGNNTNSR